MMNRKQLLLVALLAACAPSGDDPTRQGAALSAFPEESTPAYPVVLPDSSYELGVRFTPDVGGVVEGIRFYKGEDNDGPHTGRLWTAGGALLGTVDFVEESASGWQQANFEFPIELEADTEYVASYHSVSGFAYSPGYFASSGVDAPPLHLPVNAGVYFLGPPGSFPSDTNGSNYWVDVDFEPFPPELSRLWNDDTLPGTEDIAYGTEYELGVRFSAANGGVLQSVLFYKGPLNDGPHTWSVWADDGTLLADGPFDDVSPSGWQRAFLPVPVILAPGETYVASYHTTTGFAYDDDYFATPYDSGGLHVPEAGGVYAAGPTSFPTETHGANYWIDVEVIEDEPSNFDTSGLWTDAETPGNAHIDVGTPFELGLRFEAATSGTVTEIQYYKGPGNDGPHTGRLWAADGTLLAEGTFADETPFGWQHLVFEGPVVIAANTEYVASIHSATGLAYDPGFFSGGPYVNNGLVGLGSVFAVGEPGTFPTVSNGANYWVDVAFVSDGGGGCTPVCDGVACGDDDGCGDPCCLGSGCEVADCGECEHTDSCGSLCYPNEPDYQACSEGSCRMELCTNLPVPWSFYGVDDTPPSALQQSGIAYEVGVRFVADVTSNVLSVRFYKGVGNNGLHTAHLWLGDGTLLGSTTFVDESPSGWQRAYFVSPIPIAANTPYVASIHSTTGFAYAPGAFAGGFDSSPLHVVPGGGVYALGPDPTFPTESNGSSYFIDVDVGASLCTPVCDGKTCGEDDGCGTPCCAGTGCAAVDCGECGQVDGCGSSCTQVPDFTPCSSGSCGGGSCTLPPVVGLWSEETIPGNPHIDVGVAFELGVRITPQLDGLITAVQFYKDPVNDGPHTARLWSTDGVLLGETTFSDETASGWQRAMFATPILVGAGFEVVASVHSESGFAYDVGYFGEGPYVTPYLTATTSAFSAGAPGTFPTSTNGANYWVDVEVFPFIF